MLSFNSCPPPLSFLSLSPLKISAKPWRYICITILLGIFVNVCFNAKVFYVKLRTVRLSVYIDGWMDG